MTQRVLLKEAARTTGLSEWELRTGAKSGKYPHFKVGNRYVFDIDMLEQHINQMMKDNVTQDQKNENIIPLGRLRRVEA